MSAEQLALYKQRITTPIKFGEKRFLTAKRKSFIGFEEFLH